jgi:hypothetical protein
MTCFPGLGEKAAEGRSRAAHFTPGALKHIHHNLRNSKPTQPMNPLQPGPKGGERTEGLKKRILAVNEPPLRR